MRAFPANGPRSPAARVRREYIRHKTNPNAGLTADLRARSAVGCSAWLAGVVNPYSFSIVI